MKMHTRMSRQKSVAAAVVLALCLPATAQAFQIKNETGDVIGSFDTTVGIAGAWRAEGRDPALIGIINGGTSRDVNSDDGNLNYNRDKLYSSPIRVTHELGLKKGDYGMFARGTYFLDFAYDSQTVSTVSGYGNTGKDRVGRNVELLDAFVYGSVRTFGNRNLNVRFGNQVVNWGESTFIPNGISVINGVDVARLRNPGADLKEAVRPTPLIWASQGLTDNISVEGFYSFRWRETRLDPRGTYFSTTDALSPDGDKIFIGSGRRTDQHFTTSFPAAAFAGSATPTAPVWAPRTADRTPGNGDEFGLTLRMFSPEINNTEFGLAFANYHSRTPFLSGIRGAATVAGTFGLAGLGCANGSPLVNFNALIAFSATGNPFSPLFNPLALPVCPTGNAATYFADYPQNIRLFGLSFNTAGPGRTALQGEYSYRPNQPLQLATTEVILAAGGLANNITGGNAAAGGVAPGTEITGYRRVQMHQLQFTGTKIFGPMLNAESFTVVGEVGATYLNLPSGLLFAGPGVVLPGLGSSTATTAGSTQPGMEGYATQNSWGYRLVGALSYPNAIAGTNLIPRVAFSHDVHGVGPTFNQGVKAATFGLGAVLKEKWQADIAYTTYWGGRTYSGTDPLATGTQLRTYATSANPLKDRDFVSASLRYSF